MATRSRPERHYAQGEGIDRTVPRNDPEYPEGSFWDLLNCIYDKESENPEAMRGSTRLGLTAMGGTVSGLFDFDNGTKFVASCTDGKFYEYGTDWAAAATGARKSGNDTTATTQWHGTMFYGATKVKNLLVVTNGIDAPVSYDATNGWVDLNASAPATGNFPAVWQGRLWLATTSLTNYSTTNDAEDWSTDAGNIAVYRGHDGNITGQYAWANHLFIFKRRSIYRVAPTTTLAETNIKNVSSSIGCINHATIQECDDGNMLVFASERGPAALVPSNTSTGFRAINIGRKIKALSIRANLAASNVMWGLWNGDRREYYYNFCWGTKTTPTDSLICNMGRERRPPRWTRCNLANLTAGCMYRSSGTGYKHYVGDTSGMVHEFHVSTEQTWNQTPINWQMIGKFYTQGMPERMKRYNWSFVDGMTDGSYDVTIRQQLLRVGLPPTTGNTDQYSFAQADSDWGVGQWGVALWGGSGNFGQRIRPAFSKRASGMSHIIDGTRWFRLNGEVIASNLGKDNIAA